MDRVPPPPLPEPGAGMPPPPPPRSRGKQILGGIVTGIGARLLVGAVLVGGIAAWGWFTNANRDDAGDIVRGGDLNVTDLSVGDCILTPGDVDEFGEIAAVPCREPHDFEVFFNLRMGDGVFPTEDQFFEAVELSCLPAFETYTGVAYEESPNLYLDVFLPTETSWGQGDRIVNCLIYDETEQLTGSVRAE